MDAVASFLSYLVNGPKMRVIMTHLDRPAREEAIDPRSNTIPVVRGSFEYLMERRRLKADEYMSRQLVNALVDVNFSDPFNREEFVGFARELLGFKSQGFKFEVLNHGKTFILHNITWDYNYRLTFN